MHGNMLDIILSNGYFLLFEFVRCYNMKTLPLDWLTQGHIDFEYKKYLLLAYLTQVRHFFETNHLYPVYTDLKRHINYLRFLKVNKHIIEQKFPRVLMGIDLERGHLQYKSGVIASPYIKALEDIMDYALTVMCAAESKGKSIDDMVQHTIHIEPIGVLPIYKKEGFVFVTIGLSGQVKIYRYSLGRIGRLSTDLMNIKMKLIGFEQKSIYSTFTALKNEIIKKEKTLPNAAVFLISYNLDYPYHSTWWPVAKRILCGYLAA